MKIVCCTTCKGRTPHLEQTLPANLRDNANKNVKFVLLNYNSPDNLNDYVAKNHMPDIESGRLRVYQFNGRGPFRMAHAKNMAHRLGIEAGADVLVNIDADNFTGPGFADFVTEKMTGGGKFIWARMIKGVTSRGITGRIAVDVQTFIKVGGYDERYSTWSPDDKDFNQRLRAFGLTAEEFLTDSLKAVLHNDQMRFRESKSSAEPDVERTYQEHHPIHKVVVNGGRIGLGMVTRLFDDVLPYQELPLVSVAPIPTRIFGIGMHKTATTSLHHAMKTLGYESAHWKNALGEKDLGGNDQVRILAHAGKVLRDMRPSHPPAIRGGWTSPIPDRNSFSLSVMKVSGWRAFVIIGPSATRFVVSGITTLSRIRSIRSCTGVGSSMQT